MFRLLGPRAAVHVCTQRGNASAAGRRPADLKVAVAISGGVDSAVLLGLLQREGYQVVPVHMVNWDKTEENDSCTSEKDLFDAREVAKFYGLSLTEVNFVKHYWNDVFESFIEQYQHGVTPNPDIKCNELIKFGRFFDYAVNHQKCDMVATGHYARTAYDVRPDLVEQVGAAVTYSPLLSSFDSKARLLTSVDPAKDQTYFLSTVSNACLSRVLLPMGAFRKSQIRSIARSLGVPVFKKKDSYGICFVGKKNNFKQFLRQYVPEEGDGMFDQWSIEQYIRSTLPLAEPSREKSAQLLKKARALVEKFSTQDTSRRKFCKQQAELHRRDVGKHQATPLGLAALRSQTERELGFRGRLLGCTENEWVKLDEVSGRQGKLAVRDHALRFGVYGTEASERLCHRSSFVVSEVRWVTPDVPQLPVQLFNAAASREGSSSRSIDEYVAQSVATREIELLDTVRGPDAVHPAATYESVDRALRALFPLSDYEVVAGERLFAKTSSTGALLGCTVCIEHDEQLNSSRLRVQFDEAVPYPAPGQTCVLYRLRRGVGPAASAVPSFETMGLVEDVDTTVRQAHLGAIIIDGEPKKLGSDVLLECLGAGVILL